MSAASAVRAIRWAFPCPTTDAGDPGCFDLNHLARLIADGRLTRARKYWRRGLVAQRQECGDGFFDLAFALFELGHIRRSDIDGSDLIGLIEAATRFLVDLVLAIGNERRSAGALLRARALVCGVLYGSTRAHEASIGPPRPRASARSWRVAACPARAA